MKLTILAATGGVGRQLVEQATRAGHDVTAVVRDPSRLTTPVRSAVVDLAHATGEDLAPAVAGADAVLSGLGPSSNKDAGIASRGTRALVDAMTATGVRRVVVVSAAPVGTVATWAGTPPRHDPGDGVLMRYVLSPMIKRLFPGVYTDLAAMEDLLAASGLDWTAVRPPRLTDRPANPSYRTALDRNVRGGALASRADVAASMLAALARPETVGHALGVAS
jgi:nucleoside-diphosphate-sugar epimerase